MEFLKDLFTQPLSFEAFEAAINKAGFKLADLSKGQYVERLKFDEANNNLKSAKDTITTLTTELDGLKQSNATAEDWKSKFESLQQEIADKEAADKEAREKAERDADIKSRYDAVCVDKDGKPLEFTHSAIRDMYLGKFGEQLADPANKSKSDAEIFHALTKDDATAFKGITPIVNLAGANPLGTGADDSAVRAVMGLK